MSAKLYLLGLGLDPEEHATIETLQAAALCDVVFWGGEGPGAALLSRFCKDVRSAASVTPVFIELEAGKTVGWATPAHPVVFSPLAGELAARCEAANIPWETFGAVSSAGVALAASGLTLGEDIFGVQAFEASAVASGAVHINPSIPAVVHFYAAPPAPAALAAALGKVYPPGHKAAWCVSSGILETTTVAALADCAPSVPGAVLLLGAATASSHKWGKLFEFRDRAEATAATDHKRAPAWVKG